MQDDTNLGELKYCIVVAIEQSSNYSNRKFSRKMHAFIIMHNKVSAYTDVSVLVLHCSDIDSNVKISLVKNALIFSFGALTFKYSCGAYHETTVHVVELNYSMCRCTYTLHTKSLYIR